MSHGDKAITLAKQLGVDIAVIKDFSSNVNPFPPADIIDFLVEKADLVRHYPDNTYESVLEIISGVFETPKSGIILGNGSIELIKFFFLLNAGKKVLLPYPSFTEYERFASIYGLRMLRANVRSFYNPDFFTSVNANAVVLCNPNNPTGDLIPADVIEEIVKKCEMRDIMMLIDGAYMDFIPEQKEYDFLLDYEHVMVTRSLTKILALPGLRVGYGFASEKVAKKIQSMRDPWNLNILAQEVLMEYIPRLPEITEQTSRKVSKLKDEFIKDMDNISFAHPMNSKANFFLTKLDFDSEQLEYRLMERGILIRRCNDFFGLDDSFIRLCVRKREDNTTFIRVLSGLSGHGQEV